MALPWLLPRHQCSNSRNSWLCGYYNSLGELVATILLRCPCMAALQRPFSGILAFASPGAAQRIPGPPRPAGMASSRQSALAFFFTHYVKLPACGMWGLAISGASGAAGASARQGKAASPEPPELSLLLG